MTIYDRYLEVCQRQARAAYQTALARLQAAQEKERLTLREAELLQEGRVTGANVDARKACLLLLERKDPPWMNHWVNLHNLETRIAGLQVQEKYYTNLLTILAGAAAQNVDLTLPAWNEVWRNLGLEPELGEA